MKYLLRFLEPMPVMFYIFFIGLLIGVDTIIGLILTYIGLLGGTMLLLVSDKSIK